MAVASGPVDSAQNLKESTHASRPGAVDGSGPMDKSLAGEKVPETGPSVGRGKTLKTAAATTKKSRD